MPKGALYRMVLRYTCVFVGASVVAGCVPMNPPRLIPTKNDNPWLRPEVRAQRQREAEMMFRSDALPHAARNTPHPPPDVHLLKVRDVARPLDAETRAWISRLQRGPMLVLVTHALEKRGDVAGAYELLRRSVRAEDPPTVGDGELALYARLADRLGKAEEARYVRRYMGEAGKWRMLRETVFARYERGPYTATDEEYEDGLRRHGGLMLATLPGRRAEIETYLRRLRALGPNRTDRPRPALPYPSEAATRP